MARIWMNTQKEFDYLPLRWGLGQMTEQQVLDHEWDGWSPRGYYFTEITGARERVCPKIYTIRLNQLHFSVVDQRKSPVYEVVAGSRYGAKPVEPPIRFKVERSYTLFLKSQRIWSSIPMNTPDKYGAPWSYLNKDGYTLPELDLGFRGATWEDLVRVLLYLNKKATIDSQFFVHVLKPVNWYLKSNYRKIYI